VIEYLKQKHVWSPRARHLLACERRGFGVKQGGGDATRLQTPHILVWLLCPPPGLRRSQVQHCAPHPRADAFTQPQLLVSSYRSHWRIVSDAEIFVAAAKRRKADFDGDMFAGQSSGPKVRESYSFGGAGSATLQSLTEKTKKATDAAADAAATAAAEAADTATTKPKKKSLKEVRKEQYDLQLAYARSLLRSDVHWKRKIVRRGVLRKLTMLADEPEQLRNVAALFPDWTHAGYTLDDNTAETYIGQPSCLSSHGCRLIWLQVAV